MRLILTFILFLIPFLSFSQERENHLVSYHFEYGFGLTEQHDFPKRLERDEVVHFPTLDEYMIGFSFPVEEVKVTPIIGVLEISNEVPRKGRTTYEISGGIIIERKNLRLKISNRGFSLGIEF